MSAKVMIKFMDALDGTYHDVTLKNLRAVVCGIKPVGLGFTPLRYVMIWYADKKGKTVLVRVKGTWAKKMLEIVSMPCPEELRGKFEFCGATVFRRMKGTV